MCFRKKIWSGYDSGNSRETTLAIASQNSGSQ